MDIGVPGVRGARRPRHPVEDGEYDRRYGPTSDAVRQPRRRRARRRAGSRSTAISARASTLQRGTTVSSPGSRSGGPRRAGTRAGRTSTSPRRSAGRSTSRSPGRATKGRAGTRSSRFVPDRAVRPRDLTLSEEPFVGMRASVRPGDAHGHVSAPDADDLHAARVRAASVRCELLRVRVFRPDGSSRRSGFGASFGMHNGLGNRPFPIASGSADRALATRRRS